MYLEGRSDQVLAMFRKEGPSESLSLKSLTTKTATLLTLTRPCRGADLAELDLSTTGPKVAFPLAGHK